MKYSITIFMSKCLAHFLEHNQILKSICWMNEEKIELGEHNDLPNVPWLVNYRARIKFRLVYYIT